MGTPLNKRAIMSEDQLIRIDRFPPLWYNRIYELRRSVMEQWKPVSGFEGYEISTTGRLKSYKHGRAIILKPRITHDGYVWYILSNHGRGYSRRAHRLVAEAFIPNTDRGH